MLTKSGAKVLDFGLATWEGDDSLTGSRKRILHGIPPESAQSYYSMIGTVTKTILPSSVML